jgi:hypothetical protein
MMQEPVYTIGPRILEDGTNLDADIKAVHPVIKHRQIFDPVSDGSLGPSQYEAGQLNKDNSLI